VSEMCTRCRWHFREIDYLTTVWADVSLPWLNTTLERSLSLCSYPLYSSGECKHDVWGDWCQVTFWLPRQRGPKSRGAGHLQGLGWNYSVSKELNSNIFHFYVHSFSQMCFYCCKKLSKNVWHWHVTWLLTDSYTETLWRSTENSPDRLYKIPTIPTKRTMNRQGQHVAKKNTNSLAALLESL